MAAILFYLLNNPRALARLQYEIRSTFTRAEDTHMGTQLQTCCYLRACIDEAMRKTPAVAGLLPRQILNGGLSISDMGLYLPEGMEIGVPTYVIQHHADYVAEPFKCDPDWWLPQDDKLPEHRQNEEAPNLVCCPFPLAIAVA